MKKPILVSLILLNEQPPPTWVIDNDFAVINVSLKQTETVMCYLQRFITVLQWDRDVHFRLSCVRLAFNIAITFAESPIIGHRFVMFTFLQARAAGVGAPPATNQHYVGRSLRPIRILWTCDPSVLGKRGHSVHQSSMSLHVIVVSGHVHRPWS